MKLDLRGLTDVTDQTAKERGERVTFELDKLLIDGGPFNYDEAYEAFNDVSALFYTTETRAQFNCNLKKLQDLCPKHGVEILMGD